MGHHTLRSASCPIGRLNTDSRLEKQGQVLRSYVVRGEAPVTHDAPCFIGKGSRRNSPTGPIGNKGYRFAEIAARVGVHGVTVSCRLKQAEEANV